MSVHFGRHDKDATTSTDPANFDAQAAQQTLPKTLRRVIYKTDMGRGRELAYSKTMNMPFKYIWKDVHKELGLKDAVREAIAKNDMFSMQQLLEQLSHSEQFGDSLNMRLNPFGYTPLHFACKHGRNKIASMLIDMKAEVNCLTQNRDSALHCAVRSGCNMLQTVKALLQAKADVNVPTRLDRRTALHWACCQPEQESAACAIADMTIDFDKRDCNGETSADIARRRNLTGVLKVIEYMQSDANRELVQKKLLLPTDSIKRLTKAEKALLKAGGKAGEEARKKSLEVERQERFRKEKEALIAAQEARRQKELDERKQRLGEHVAQMRQRVAALQAKGGLKKRSSKAMVGGQRNRLETAYETQQRRVHKHQSEYQKMFPVGRVKLDPSSIITRMTAKKRDPFAIHKAKPGPVRRLMLSNGQLVKGRFASETDGTLFQFDKSDQATARATATTKNRRHTFST